LPQASDRFAVCEDAITVKNDASGDHSWIIGGGAYKAADKVVQHNGCGTVNIIVSLLLRVFFFYNSPYLSQPFGSSNH
jgi:hypothetical protein